MTTNTTNIATSTTNITNLTDAVNGLGDDSLLWNKVVGTFSATHNAEATSRTTNITAGNLTADSTDTINGSQLKTTSDSVTTNTTSIATNTTNIINLTGTVNGLGDDSLLWNKTAGTFSAAHGTDTTSKITSVIASNPTAGGTDAVNGSRLKITNNNMTANTTNIVTNTINITNLIDAVNGPDDDSLLRDKTAGALSAAHDTNAISEITNVGAGDLTAGNTDAVNGSQLKTASDNVSTNATNITNLTGAVSGFDDDSLLWNKTAGAFSTVHGTDTASKITDVEAGDLIAGSIDAVSGSQLRTANDNVSANTTNIANPMDSVGGLKDDSLLWNKAAGAFSAAYGTEAISKVTNLLAGKISSNSTDAINGSQLYDIANSLTSYLGGGADINDTGVLSGPAYTISGTDYTNVDDVLATINTSFNASPDDTLLWDATAGKFSAKHGINNASSVIIGVVNGAVSPTNSDTIDGSQLCGVSDYIAGTLGGNAVANTDGNITISTYAIAGGSYDNVGDALEAINTTLDDALL